MAIALGVRVHALGFRLNGLGEVVRERVIEQGVRSCASNEGGIGSKGGMVTGR
eukprot:CAMPEP_0183586328 /NCGR_PEP_ID=MMETSP0371-20130417/157002_1 /TAXON_ID=268820 /ORGANISM="Peridinium aciculiferum, Strain PAER-2" /LENGTH=52 /DNA_ID=CAMNT_0025797393 /DNA_START=222 /DNA_END=380 /DNA_ORIENTATION=+